MKYSAIVAATLLGSAASASAFSNNAPREIQLRNAHKALEAQLYMLHRRALDEAEPLAKRDCKKGGYNECREGCSNLGYSGARGGDLASALCGLGCGPANGCNVDGD